MRHFPLPILVILFLSSGEGRAASPASAVLSAGDALEPSCELGRQQIEALIVRDHVGPIILSGDPVAGYDELGLSASADPTNRVPAELKQAWKRQPRTNLLDACPELASLPGVRLALPTDDTETYGSGTAIYYFSAPVFTRSHNDALIVEGFYCSGRCGGYAINHYQRNGTRWDRQVPLAWLYG
jgi:hypothetical protein